MGRPVAEEMLFSWEGSGLWPLQSHRSAQLPHCGPVFLKCRYGLSFLGSSFPPVQRAINPSEAGHVRSGQGQLCPQDSSPLPLSPFSAQVELILRAEYYSYLSVSWIRIRISFCMTSPSPQMEWVLFVFQNSRYELPKKASLSAQCLLPAVPLFFQRNS